MGKDKEDNQPPDAEDVKDLQAIDDAVKAAEDWEAQNPDPQR